MATLKEQGIYGNTIIMLASDNSPHVKGGHNPDFFNSNEGLRGYKRDLYKGHPHTIYSELTAKSRSRQRNISYLFFGGHYAHDSRCH